MSRFNNIAIVCAALLTAGLSGCAQSLTGDGSLVPLMSLQQEEVVGRAQHPRMLAAFGGAYQDDTLDAYIGGLTRRLRSFSSTPNAVRRVTVLNSPGVNAFALPGGYIYITRGLLSMANDEAEIAMVIAHEIGHVSARHPAKRLARLASAEMLDSVVGRMIAGTQAQKILELGNEGYIAQYSRVQEFEADALGIKIAAQAGYDPDAALTFLHSMERDQKLQARLANKSPEYDAGTYMAAHPPTPARISQAEKVVQSLDPGGVRHRTKYLSKIEELIYGDAPENGVVRGRRFLQPSLRFTFTVPKGYVIHNRPNAVIALGPDNRVILFDGVSVRAKLPLATYLKDRWGGALGIEKVQTFSVNGMPAASGFTRLGTLAARLIAIRYSQDTVYRFIILGNIAELTTLSGAIKRLALSFRQLSASEARQVRPLRIKIRDVRAGDTVRSIARGTPFSTARIERFRVLNGLENHTPLQVGAQVKVVGG
ncbi:MAG: M48 family metalloprotease [Alphaproteobacteria bacterium]